MTVTDRDSESDRQDEAADDAEQDGGLISQKHTLPLVIHSVPFSNDRSTCGSRDLVLTRLQAE